MLKLIENEVSKILSKKKLILISAILIVLVVLFAHGQNLQYKNTISRYLKSTGQTTSSDWKPLIKQQISDLNNRLNNPATQESIKHKLTIDIAQYQYYLDNNVNPITPGAAKFSIQFMQQAIYMFLPLLIIILAGDSVSGEFSSKTIKVLLTRAVPRWKVLLSKYIALLILTSIVILETLIFCIITAAIMFKTLGFNEPVATGFKAIAGKLDPSNVIQIYQWQYIILVYALGWFVSIVVGTISFMVSVLVRNTATSIGIMMAALTGGSFMQFFIADWPLVKYFFAINLNLPQYLSGSYQPISGMTLTFSILVLSVWALGALTISFFVFNKQDVLV